MVLGGDLLYGMGPHPRRWHYLYRAIEMHKDMDVPHILPAVCMTDDGVLAVFGRITTNFRCLGVDDVLYGVWTRAPKTNT
jgi:hypothetical protein